MSKTHWKQLINPDYIGAYALTEGEDLTVTIDFVRVEEVAGADGKKESCTVARLVGQKPMILNITNSKTIARLYGPYVEDWAGKRITLYASTVKAFGETVECLRVRPKVMVKQKSKINADRFTKAIASIKAGEFTTDKLRNNFALTDAQETELEEALHEAAV